MADIRLGRITRADLAARPRLAVAHGAFCEAQAAFPADVVAFASRWLTSRGCDSLVQCSDNELEEFASEVRAEALRIRRERTPMRIVSPPPPRSVTEIEAARVKARAESVMRSDDEDWRRERLRRALDAAVHAARLEWLALGGQLEQLPHLQWASPIPEPFKGVTGQPVGTIRHGDV